MDKSSTLVIKIAVRGGYYQGLGHGTNLAAARASLFFMMSRFIIIWLPRAGRWAEPGDRGWSDCIAIIGVENGDADVAAKESLSNVEEESNWHPFISGSWWHHPSCHYIMSEASAECSQFWSGKINRAAAGDLVHTLASVSPNTRDTDLWCTWYCRERASAVALLVRCWLLILDCGYISEGFGHQCCSIKDNRIGH